MASHRNIRGMLHNFLGTYTSRYSDFDGYWLFGLLVDDISELYIDLIEVRSECNDTMPMIIAKQLAVTKFSEQMEKVGLPTSCIREAHLKITKSPELIDGFVNGWLSSGYQVKFVVEAVTDLGKTYESTLSLFVALHNPKVEQRSGRALDNFSKY